MNGKKVDSILKQNGYSQKEIAERLGISQQLLSKKLNVQDVKTTFLEQLCDLLSVDMSYFYKGTNYCPAPSSVGAGSISTDIVSKFLEQIDRLTKTNASQNMQIRLLSELLAKKGGSAPMTDARSTAAK